MSDIDFKNVWFYKMSLLLYKNIGNLGILSNEGLDFIKTRTKEVALPSYQNCNNNALQYLSREEFLALQNLRTNKNIVIQKSDKSNSVVNVNNTDYSDNMENLLNDKHKFEKNNLKNAGILSFAVNKEKRVNNIFKKFVASNSISGETRRFIKPVRTGLVIIYGIGKVHKDIINNFPCNK